MKNKSPSLLSNRLIFPLLITLFLLLTRLPQLNPPPYLPNADHTIVGLQASHILKGEWKWFLWGCGYQGIVEPLLVAIGFFFWGQSYIILLLVAFTAMLLTTLLIYHLLRKTLSPVKAFFATSPVFLGAGVFLLHSSYPPRQWCFPPIFLALAFFLAGKEENRQKWFHLCGGFLLFFALYIDYFAIQFLFSTALCGLLAACPPHNWKKSKTLRWFILGVLIGAAFLAFTRLLGPEGKAPLGFRPPFFMRNLNYFVFFSLPDLIGFSRNLYWQGMSYEKIDALFYPFRIAASFLFLSGLFYGGILSFNFREKMTVQKILGIFGSSVICVSTAGFLFSAMPAGTESSRYLTPFIFAAPFVFATLLYKRGIKLTSLFLVPYLFLNGILLLGDWSNYLSKGGGFNSYPLRAEEKELQHFLEEKKIRYGYADYWPAYRLTFFLGESTILVPINPQQDRYAPYRKAVENADYYVYIFDRFEKPLIREHVLLTLSRSKKHFKEYETGFYKIILVGSR
jgi:hypothetical protein